MVKAKIRLLGINLANPGRYTPGYPLSPTSINFKALTLGAVRANRGDPPIFRLFNGPDPDE